VHIRNIVQAFGNAPEDNSMEQPAPDERRRDPNGEISRKLGKIHASS
jgi:hypothetical protein